MASAFVHLREAPLTGWMGEWRSGSAAALHAVGRGFESLFAYHSPPFVISAAHRVITLKHPV